MILKASSIAFVVSLLCLIIPVVHLLSGPLAPAIGGFVGAGTIASKKTQAPFIGLSLAVFWVGIVLVLYFFKLAYPDFFSFLGNSLLIPVLVVFLWASTLGTLGATIASNKGH